MSQTILAIEEIVSDPKIRRGRPVIKGTGLRVSDIILAHTTGDKLSAEEIADHWQLDIGKIHAALAYYYLHHDEIDAEIREDEEETYRVVAELEAQGKLVRRD